VIGVPTLAQVRAWVQVPATVISDEDLQQILDAELAIQARTCRLPTDPSPGPVVLAVADMTATVTATGGTPGAAYWIAWGDTYSDQVVLDDDGAATAEHTYTEEGQQTAVLYNDAMQVLGYYQFDVPGNGSTAPQATYPEALARACLRRCQRQVAARAVPLGMLGADSTEYGPVTMPRWDAEIGRLEASYRQVVVS
jgi:hypothetical protein